MQASPIGEASNPMREARELDGLVERYAHRASYFARRIRSRYGLDPQFHDDLVSAGHWGLLQALHKRRPDAHANELSAYVSKRVEGAVLDEARRILARGASHSEVEPDALDPAGAACSAAAGWAGGGLRPDPESLADRRARWRAIERCVATLRLDHRALLVAYAEGRSIPEIARRHGVSPARLQNQLARIARQLRASAPELRRLLRHDI